MANGELFQELYLDVSKNSLPAGARVGPLIVAPHLSPHDPTTGKLAGDDMESQLRTVFGNMDKLLANAGCERKDVARITLFMRQVSDRTAMNKVYQEWFPDENTRPPHKYLPAELPEGVHVIAQFVALAGSNARAIEIPGIHHNDWMSLGGLSGNLLTSSRIFGTDPTTGKGNPEPAGHTAIIFENADRLLALAGGSWKSMSQATVFYKGDQLIDLIRGEWNKRGSSDAEDGPQLNLVETDLGGQTRDGLMLPRVEIIALV